MLKKLRKFIKKIKYEYEDRRNWNMKMNRPLVVVDVIPPEKIPTEKES